MESRQPLTFALRPIEDTDVTTWELPEGAIGRLGRGIVADLAFSPDGESLAIATTAGAWVYELATMEPIALLATERGLVSTVSFSPNGQWIATSNWDGIIKVWETETQRCTAKIQGWHGGTSQLAFSPDSQYLAASGKDYGDVYVWNAETGMHVASFTNASTPKKGERATRQFSGLFFTRWAVSRLCFESIHACCPAYRNERTHRAPETLFPKTDTRSRLFTVWTVPCCWESKCIYQSSEH